MLFKAFLASLAALLFVAAPADAQFARRATGFANPNLPVGLVTTRNAIPDTVTGGNKYYNSSITVTTTAALRDNLQFVLPCYVVTADGTQPGEAGPGAACTRSASIEYPVGTIAGFSACSGTAQCTVSDGGQVITDKFSVASTIPAGATIRIRLWFHSTAGIVYSGGTGIFNNGAGDVFCVDSAALPDMTQNSAAVSTGGGTCVTNSGIPAVIGLLGPTPAPSVIIAGDSISCGFTSTGSTNATDFRRGVVAQSLNTTTAFLNACSGGGQVTQWRNTAGFATNRLAMLPYATTVASELGTNDINVAGRTAAQVQGDLEWLLSQATKATVKVQTTVDFKSTSTDSWATTANQTALNPSGSSLDTLNTTIRAVGMAGQTKAWDTAATIEAVLHGGKYIVTGAANYCTNDGIHPSVTCYGVVAASGAVNKDDLR